MGADPDMKSVFIIGSKGIPARYGGFETFVDELTARSQRPRISYHVACLSSAKEKVTLTNSAHCFHVRLPNLGPLRNVLYDVVSLRHALRTIRQNEFEGAVIYILACRIGPVVAILRRLGRLSAVRICVNPDGHEWKRTKWNRLVRRYWKFSERLMVKHSDLVICDAQEMERYIREEYRAYSPKTLFIPYGADLAQGAAGEPSENLAAWFRSHDLESGGYYLVVGRFVPENNYRTILEEFRKTKSPRKLVFITDARENRYGKRLRRATGFHRDPRILFAGTLYDKQLLREIRAHAFAYIHGHEVGGTNPSLVESLACTRINLLLDVAFNREVGGDGACFFTKEPGSLAGLVAEMETSSSKEIEALAQRARNRITECYRWRRIVEQYEELFTR